MRMFLALPEAKADWLSNGINSPQVNFYSPILEVKSWDAEDTLSFCSLKFRESKRGKFVYGFEILQRIFVHKHKNKRRGQSHKALYINVYLAR